MIIINKRDIVYHNFKQDISILPKNKNGNIDWNECAGYTINFELDGNFDSYEIIDVIKDGNKINYLTVKYKNQTKNFKPSYIRNGNLITFLRGHRMPRKQYNIGDTMICNNSLFTVLGVSVRRIKENGHCKFIPFYFVECKKCHVRYWKSSKKLLTGCHCCNGDITFAGINDIGTIAPWMEQYFSAEDKHLMFENSVGSNVKFKPVCPLCGVQSSKEYMINYIHGRHGVVCNCSSDGMSYSEKYIGNLLGQLGIPFIQNATTRHLGFDANHKKYDFYIPSYSFIIESHGMQHYKTKHREKKWRDYEEEVNNDREKEKVARENGIKNYVQLDCRSSYCTFIKNAILNSDIPKILGFTENDINWDECNTAATKNLVKVVCDDFMENLTSRQMLADKYHISNWAVVDYIKRGHELGWANYLLFEIVNSINVPVKVIKHNGEILMFKTKHDMQDYCKKNNIPFSMMQVNKVIDTDKTYKGCHFYTIKSKDDLFELVSYLENH